MFATKGRTIKQNFRSHLATQVRRVNNFLYAMRGVDCVRTDYSVCIFCFLEV